jgi:hypothetical protein
MQHFVIKDVFQKPRGNKSLIQPWIDPNDSLFFLDRAENKVFAGALPSFLAPNNLVTAETVAEIAPIQFVEYRAEIEITTSRLQPELSLQRQLWPRDFSFGSFRHIPCLAPKTSGETIDVN